MVGSVAKARQARGGRLTRREAAARLGLSVASVRRMEGRTLHPERDGAGVWLFSSSEVDRLATQRTAKPRVRAASDDAGVIAGRAFELFDEGCDLREIVVDLRQTPHVIRELYNEWLLDLETGRADAQREKDEREYERMVGAFAPSTRGRDRAERQSTSKS